MLTALEQMLIRAYKNQVIEFMHVHPEYFEKAIQLSLSDKQPYAWRAAFLLGSIMKENDHRVQKYLDKILKEVTVKKDGHQRELLKILYRMELTEEQEGYLFDIWETIWETINKTPSERYWAFKFIVKTAKKYPDLENEIEFLTQEHYIETLSPGVKHSLQKMIKELKK